jgi:hypothetical protein
MNDQKKVFQTQSPSSQQIKINLQPEIARGIYSNVALIRHTENEFIFDFIINLDTEAHLVSRIFLSPEHAKKFLTALKENVDKYENKLKQLNR